ncbi:N-acetylmuramoyl-L-alanine amidase [Planosporangium mesophilum]|uniref:N-acetylmuramoyl-L-alanine amidase n=1 Tax=Planosporangium mesophilum TaxID=689768 RepID=A0A8J3X2W3_9ACTN|nr:peptidoglycan recognition family protein [Planosporangium mesophilum]NJC85696.1 N-acetylmuramoyl-L-alanine amidase [Planosporangium mesophilum]GII24844.1 amidase [Planosporangium mesophilum]
MTAYRYLAGAAALAGLVAAGAIVATTASAQTEPAPPAGAVTRLAHEPTAADFTAAAREFAVPEPLLLAYSYALTRWQDHAGLPSAQGGYGPMHLTSPDAVAPSGRGGGRPDTVTTRLRSDPARNTLARAAGLVGQPASRLRTDLTQNVRGGAALLADEARRAGIRPGTLADWYPVVARLSGASGTTTLADDIFDTLRAGATDARLRLAAQPGTAAPRRLAVAGAGQAECPTDLTCTFVPAAYAWNNTADANDYGNYDPANRPADGNKIRYIVIHDTEGSFDGTVQWFQNPAAYTSAHYVIRSSDGAVTQMVRTKDVAWHAGNWNINAESIGIEHEGVAVDGATWYTDAMYRSSAKLVRYLSARYRIPLDRQHILGHDDVANDGNYTTSHWDPGPFWDWDRYFSLLRGGVEAQTAGKLVTIRPKFATNRPPLRYCDSSGCRDLPAQPTNAVLLRTEPRDDAPLLPDAQLGGGATNDIADWSDKAVAGRGYAVAGRTGDWTAIWYGGQKAWLHTADVRPAAGTTVRPKPGAQVPVFAAALPEPSEWPAGTPAGQPSTPPTMKAVYTISGDQRYQLADLQRAEYYYARFDDANVPLNHTMVVGAASYYRISFNHRYMYVRSSDVTVD